MGLIERGRRITHAVSRLPGVRRILALDYERTFSHCPSNWFRGVYQTFGEAEASIPPGGRVGYDHASMAEMYRGRMLRACESDYPVLFWMRRILEVKPDAFVFDFGGHVGVSYHGWRDYLDFRPGLRWLVHDVPAIAQAGAALARERAAPGLAFTSDRREGRGCDVFLAAGSLQYLEEPLPSILGSLGRSPRHLVVNKLPLYDGDPFVTVQSTGRAFHAYQIQNRARFVAGITALGYRVVDDWSNRETCCRIPFAEGRDIDAYSGYYFRLDGEADSREVSAAPR